MEAGRRIGVGLVVAAALVAAVPDANAARPVRLPGKLGGTLPKASSGVSSVEAMGTSNGAVAAARYLDRRGGFSLNVPAGPYALIAGSVFKRSLPTVKLTGALNARVGRARRVSLSLGTFRRRTTHHLLARGAVLNEPTRARRVGVQYFTGGHPWENRGLASMVETDLVLIHNGPSPCAFNVLEVMRRSEIIRELRLQQTRFFDPASRVPLGHLLSPTQIVKGSLVSHGEGDVSYNIRVVNARTGRVRGAVSGRTSPSNYLSISETIARRLATIICGGLNFRITGYTESEQADTASGHRSAEHRLSGGPGPVAELVECTTAGCTDLIQLQGTITSTFNGRVTGTASPSCPGGSFTYPESSIQNQLRVVIVIPPDANAPATSGAGTVPEVGDSFLDPCNAHESGESQGLSAGVPIDDLLGGEPVTFSWSGSGTVSSFGNHPGTPITWALSQSLTVQRVKADGSHL